MRTNQTNTELPVKPLTLDSLLDSKNLANEFISKQEGPSWKHPLTFIGIGSSNIGKKLSIKESTRIVTGYNKQPDKIEATVEFHFEPTGNSKAGKLSVLTFDKKDVIRALANPTRLENGDKGIFLSQRFLFNPFCETGGLAMTFNFFLGSGYGDQNIAMIFDKNNKLKDINITEKYRGERTLFTAKNLISMNEVHAQEQLMRERQQQEDEKLNEARRFNF